MTDTVNPVDNATDSVDSSSSSSKIKPGTLSGITSSAAAKPLVIKPGNISGGQKKTITPAIKPTDDKSTNSSQPTTEDKVTETTTEKSSSSEKPLEKPDEVKSTGSRTPHDKPDEKSADDKTEVDKSTTDSKPKYETSTSSAEPPKDEQSSKDDKASVEKTSDKSDSKPEELKELIEKKGAGLENASENIMQTPGGWEQSWGKYIFDLVKGKKKEGATASDEDSAPTDEQALDK